MKSSLIQFCSTIGLIVAALPILIRGAEFNKCQGATNNWALTFDDGPITGLTATLLDSLKAKNVKATFHVVATYMNVPAVQALVARAKAEGHVIGVRYDTTVANLTPLTDDVIVKSATDAANTIAAQLNGAKPKFIRLPFNGYDARVIATLEKAGFVVTTFSLDSNDSGAASPAVVTQAYATAITSLGSNTKFPYISVQHDASANSVAAVPDVITAIQTAGYNLVTIDTCTGVSGAYQGGSDAPGNSKNSADNLASWSGLALVGSTALAVAFQIV